ncbi:MAG: ATP-binding protein [Acidimicrobiaceae bacterium]|nr:ATP-binding protein [Acidimicrobiaceae bacterium]
MIEREIMPRLRRLFELFPFVTVTGPRQAGKTTLCRAAFDDLAYVSLDAADAREQAESDPRGLLAELGTPAIIDEIQHVPALLSYLKERADEAGSNGQYVLTGSANLRLTEAVSESLAGRTALLRLMPLSLAERRLASPQASANELIFGGFYPRIVDQQLEPRSTLADYFETYVERDVRLMGGVGDLTAFRNFAALCAGRIGQLANLSSLGDDAGVTHTTARQWMTVLERSYIAFLLQPHFANIRKRLVRTPKIYFYDVGLASYLLGIEYPEQVATHPLRGVLFENLVVTEALKHRWNRGFEPRLSFFRDSRGLECDLLYETGWGINAIEIKSGATVNNDMFRALRKVADVLPNVTAKTLVYGGERSQTRTDVDIVPLVEFAAALARFDTETVVTVSSEGAPVVGADVLALFPNGTRVTATADDKGVARLDLHADDLPMTVFVAGPSLSAHVSTDWVPARGALSVELAPLTGGGSAIFEDQTGYLPGIEGRLNSILDGDGRTYLYTTNVAVNGTLSSGAVYFKVGDETLHLEDANGGSSEIRFVAMSGQSSLLEYHTPRRAG